MGINVCESMCIYVHIVYTYLLYIYIYRNIRIVCIYINIYIYICCKIQRKQIKIMSQRLMTQYYSILYYSILQYISVYYSTLQYCIPKPGFWQCVFVFRNINRHWLWVGNRSPAIETPWSACLKIWNTHEYTPVLFFARNILETWSFAKLDLVLPDYF